jgi:hypothetical protein
MKGKLVLSVAAFALLSGCGDAINCAIQGDNVHGRVNFTAANPPRSDREILVEISNTGSFGAVTDTVRLSNTQGLMSVPFSLCTAPNTTYAFRAYQDDNQDSAFTSGEPNGRHDGTTNGHAAIVPRTIPSPAAATSSDDSWPEISAVDIDLDSNAAQ